jgi:predicted deacylase
VPEPFRIAGVKVRAGERAAVRIPVMRRYTHAELFLPAWVVHGAAPGPRLFVSAAIHGDEICGVEIIRRLLERPVLGKLAGTLIAVPVVNVYGFLNHDRYLPDRRDLNRSFPGSRKGSLTARLAHRFMSQVVAHATHGIDLHTGSLHRQNLPQVRACLDDPETERLARAFGAPVMMHANLRDGSLRQAVADRGIPMLLYEGGEALRFDEQAIEAGLEGIVGVMRAIGMLPPRKAPRRGSRVFVGRSSRWLRASQSGILHHPASLGARVQRGQVLGVISSPLEHRDVSVSAPIAGLVIGRTNLPLVHEGDALFHIATVTRVKGPDPEYAGPAGLESQPDDPG